MLNKAVKPGRLSDRAFEVHYKTGMVRYQSTRRCCDSARSMGRGAVTAKVRSRRRRICDVCLKLSDRQRQRAGSAQERRSVCVLA